MQMLASKHIDVPQGTTYYVSCGDYYKINNNNMKNFDQFEEQASPTKVQALVWLLRENGGSADWEYIYANIERYYPHAKVSKEWKAGLRGVLYRQIRKKRTFEKTGPACYGLKS